MWLSRRRENLKNTLCKRIRRRYTFCFTIEKNTMVVRTAWCARWYFELDLLYLFAGICRLRFKNVKESNHGRYTCLVNGIADDGDSFSKWCNFTLTTYKRSETTGVGKYFKTAGMQSLSHRKDGGFKPRFTNKINMDNNVALLVDDTRTLSCPFESEYSNYYYLTRDYSVFNQLWNIPIGYAYVYRKLWFVKLMSGRF